MPYSLQILLVTLAPSQDQGVRGAPLLAATFLEHTATAVSASLQMSCPRAASLTLSSSGRTMTLPSTGRVANLLVPCRPRVPRRPKLCGRSTILVYAEWPKLDDSGKAVPAPATISNELGPGEGLRRTLLLGVLFSGWCESDSPRVCCQTRSRMFSCKLSLIHI